MEKQFVGALIYNHEGRLLLYKHIGKTPAWRIPGGKVERNETPQDAVKREVREETGLDTAFFKLTLAHVTQRYVDGANWTGHIFKAQLPTIDQARLFEPDKCNAMGWFDKAELATMDYIDDEVAA